MLPVDGGLSKGPGEQQGNQIQHQLDGHRPPETTQYISIAPGPPRIEQYDPVITVRVVPPLPFLACTYNFYYCAFNCRRRPTTGPLVAFLFLTI